MFACLTVKIDERSFGKISDSISVISLLGWNSENEKTESVNENENKENKNVDVFQEYILQQNRQTQK